MSAPKKQTAPPRYQTCMALTSGTQKTEHAMREEQIAQDVRGMAPLEQEP